MYTLLSKLSTFFANISCSHQACRLKRCSSNIRFLLVQYFLYYIPMLGFYLVRASNQAYSFAMESSTVLPTKCRSKPVLWLPNQLGLQGKFRQNCQNVEAPQSGGESYQKRFIELDLFTVIVNKDAKKEVARLLFYADHGHLYLVIIAVNVLQFDATNINGKTVALNFKFCAIKINSFTVSGLNLDFPWTTFLLY